MLQCRPNKETTSTVNKDYNVSTEAGGEYQDQDMTRPDIANSKAGSSHTSKITIISPAISLDLWNWTGLDGTVASCLCLL